MLSLFRTNQFIANIFLIFYAAIFRLSAFLVPPQTLSDTGGVLANWIFQWISPFSFSGSLTAFFLVVFQGVLINIILARHRMASELSLLPGMFYVFLASSISEFLYLSPVLLATTFYLLALYEMFASYKKYTAAGQIFNIGLGIGVASLFYPSMVAFLLLAVLGLRILRAFKFKEQLILTCGFVAPYFLSFVWFFFTDQYQYFLETQIINGFSFMDYSKNLKDWIFYVKAGFFVTLTLFLLANFNRFMLKRKIEIQKDISVLYLGGLFAFLSFFIQANVGLDHFFLAVPSLGILLSFAFLNLSRPIAEAIHLLMLFGVLILQYHTWWIG